MKSFLLKKRKTITAIMIIAALGTTAAGCGAKIDEASVDDAVSNTYAVFDGDGESFLEVMPQEFINSALESEEFSTEEDVAEFFEGMITSAYADIGYEGHSYKILEINKIEGEELKELKKTYEDAGSGLDFNNAVSVDTELTIKANNRESKAELTLNLIDIDGEWKLDVYSFANAAASLNAQAEE